MQHVFYDDATVIDFRYMVGAEVFDFDGDDESPPDYGIGFLLEVGHTPQRLAATYTTKALRDQAFQRLIAMHQAWDVFIHAPHDDDDE